MSGIQDSRTHGWINVSNEHRRVSDEQEMGQCVRIRPITLLDSTQKPSLSQTSAGPPAYPTEREPDRDRPVQPEIW